MNCQIDILSIPLPFLSDWDGQVSPVNGTCSVHCLSLSFYLVMCEYDRDRQCPVKVWNKVLAAGEGKPVWVEVSAALGFSCFWNAKVKRWRLVLVDRTL